MQAITVGHRAGEVSDTTAKIAPLAPEPAQVPRSGP